MHGSPSDIDRINSCAEEITLHTDNWEETARQNQLNTDYYHSLVEEIGKELGQEAYISDDGSIQQDVICAKVPELVRVHLSNKKKLKNEHTGNSTS